MKCKIISIDLAKNVFQVCAVDEQTKPIFNTKLNRTDLMRFMAQQAPNRVVMEACYSAHYWGRELAKLGHTPLLIPAQHVTPFVRGNKNDHNDALAIAEASLRPNIRFVPVKTEHQQLIQAQHRIRERLVKGKTAISNQIRGLLSESGIIFPQGHKSLVEKLSEITSSEQYSEVFRSMVAELHREYLDTRERIANIEKNLKSFLDNSPYGQILLSIPGIGLIVASALLASIDKGQAFNSPRESAVWLGLTPQQYASGTSSRMGGITKRGDRYLRKQLVHGARTVICHAKDKTDALSLWANQLVARRGFNKAAVAMAHKLARLIWILLQRQENYCPQPVVSA